MIEAMYGENESEYIGFLRVEEDGAVLRMEFRDDGGAPDVFLDAKMVERLPEPFRGRYRKKRVEEETDG